MEQNFSVAIYFSKNKTLLSVLERTETAFYVHYVKSFSAVDLNDITSEAASMAVFEIGDALENFIGQTSRVFVTVDTNYYTMTSIPGNVPIGSNEFSDLMNLEIRQTNPDASIDDYRIKLTQLPAGTGSPMNLVVIISNAIVDAADAFIQNFGLRMTDINPIPFSAINTFTYNYPDNATHNCLLVNLYDPILGFAIISNNNLLGIEYVTLTKDASIAETIESKIDSIMQSHNITDLDAIYFFGDEINRDQYFVCWEVGLIKGGDSRRLNPFRMVKTNLEQRDQEYCARVFHQYVSCIGGALPTFFPVSVR
ncbi:MAG: hypothetical protein LBO69_09315 [Ignavibacteria bacterium]|jgi:hypothetical protein|nr:hypothetical protein [Ignavibacteria bacterium]